MAKPSGFRIDTTEQFQHLPSAPIHEAAIGISAYVKAPWVEADVGEALKARVKDYPHLDSTREWSVEGRLEPGKGPTQSIRDKGWKGYHVRSLDQKYVAQFNRDGFVFSRLRPYEDWDHFFAEAMRLWQAFLELGRPEEVGRLGLRYINRFALSPNARDVENYLDPSPQTPRSVGLTLRQFLHHDLLSVPESCYAVNVVKTIQELPGTSGPQCYAILDIDAFAQETFEISDLDLRSRFLDLRWLKNKVFFGSITDRALAAFKEESHVSV